jgi:nucleoside-diphosphate-sugar epimerase
MGPARIEDVEHLEALLSEPTPVLVETLTRLPGDVMVLGVGGKMGPTLARMVRRASEAAGVRRRVVGVARFSAESLEARLQAQGVETIRCDLLHDPLDRLPDVPNIVYLVGMKFGSTGHEALTWAMNAYLPALVCRRFRTSRIVALSTGNVYPLSPVSLGGSVETDPPGPVGEYAQSCLGRERLLEHFSRTLGIPMALIRLNYATELRYGVLVDVALKVQAGMPIDVTMGHLNAIWQADASAMALQAFDHAASPPFVVNVAGPETLSVRRVAEQLGYLLYKPATVTGTEAPDALLSNGQLGHRLFGYPRVSAQQLLVWIADWAQRGGPTLGKPTHFEVRDGKF